MAATTVPAVPAIPAPVRVDLGLYPDIQKFGAADISACFSCGTCSATCPMSQTDGTFPRRIIRYAQLGMKDALLGSKELWTCYQCGECAETCPTQADPSEFMAATRRYAIASYDRTHLARTMYTRPIVATVLAVLIAAFFAAFMYTAHGPMSGESLAIFEFIPEGLIHNTGIVVMILVVVAGLVGVATMARDIGRREGVSLGGTLGSRAALGRTGRALWSAIGRESIGQVRFREECEADAVASAVPWYRRRWLVHALVVWGFLGLLLATGLDYGLALVGIKETGTPVPVWYPVRLLGTGRGGRAGLWRHGPDHRPLPGRQPLRRQVHHRRLAAARPAVGDGRDRLRDRARPVPAQRPGLGLLAVPCSRRGRDGARAPRPVHEAGPRGVPARGTVLRGTGRPAKGDPAMTQSLPQVAHEHHERILAHVDRMPEMADALLTDRADAIRDSVIATGEFLNGTLLPHIDCRRADHLPRARADVPEPALDGADAPRA